MTRGQIDALQGVVGFIGVTVGVIPLVRWMIQGEHGAVFRWLFGNPTGLLGYLVPLVFLAVVVAAIAGLEMLKRRA
ncbi:hypothetical protein MOQ72_26475 [Saccharopolyspora sp. K220]|uniref:hypothetical protein n=1 Tax=Saccharopolyspora soli TaxID=2926618 RepID=UPI001F57682C|nr:hypothetical protein [Saccharopolyspora soli]MCI2420994.1 hypothetical protein [Saccharopolyspora soli]